MIAPTNGWKSIAWYGLGLAASVCFAVVGQVGLAGMVLTGMYGATVPGPVEQRFMPTPAPLAAPKERTP